MIKVNNVVNCYDNHLYLQEAVKIEISNHDLEGKYINMKIGNFTATVKSDDLLAAIKNATNVNRY
jgi:hypothetical protein